MVGTGLRALRVLALGFRVSWGLGFVTVQGLLGSGLRALRVQGVILVVILALGSRVCYRLGVVRV